LEAYEAVFRKVALTLAPSKIWVAEVLTNGGPAELATRFELEPTNFPAYLLFKCGDDPTAPVVYSGEIAEAPLLAWIEAQTLAQTPRHGRLEAFETLIHDYSVRGVSKLADTLAAVKLKASDLKDDAEKTAGDAYVHLLEKVTLFFVFFAG
jgi:hypothetical protein